MLKKLLAVMALMMITAAPVLAAGENHRIAFHVDENDPQVMNMTLNNVQNVIAYYEGLSDTVDIEVVAYGAGLHMLRADTSPVATRIAAMALENDTLVFAACGNTHRKMSANAGTKIELLQEAQMVPSGVVELVMLQEKGWAYIRP